MTETKQKASKPLKIFFHSVEGVGHLNGCIGMAQALAKRGHKIFFIMNEDVKGKLVEYGFEEILLKKPELPQPPPAPPQNGDTQDGPCEPPNPLKEFAKIMLKAGIIGSTKTPLENMRDQLTDKDDMMGAMALATATAFNPQIKAAMQREQPDVFIIDSFSIPPAVQSANIPWVFLSSAQPLCIFPSKGKLPPYGAGFASNSDPDTWQEYSELWKRYRWEKFAQYQDKLNQAFGYKPPMPVRDGETLFPNSPYLNLYGYPEALDYADLYHIPDQFVRVDAFMREVAEPEFIFPEGFKKTPGKKLVYVSMGTLGSIDIDLMQRITSALAKSRHSFIVSKGQRADEYDLPPNCWGQAFVPQLQILTHVDLVISHAGNNTVTEALYYGKPMILMPLFGDQFDGAQRVQEKGFGVRLEPYKFTESQLLEAIDRLLDDQTLADRLKLVKRQMVNSNSKQNACERVEKLVEYFQTKH